MENRRGNGDNPLMAIIQSQDWAPIDSLPLSAKILLASRLLDGVGLDLAHLRVNLWHDADQGFNLPVLPSAGYDTQGEK